MNNIQNNKIIKVARWMGIAVASIFAISSWYCLLQDTSGAAVLSVTALSVLLLSLFTPELVAAPVRFCFGRVDSVVLFLRVGGLFCFYCIVIWPWGMIATLFGRDFLFEEKIQRSRKYHHKSPGSYWVDRVL